MTSAPLFTRYPQGMVDEVYRSTNLTMLYTQLSGLTYRNASDEVLLENGFIRHKDDGEYFRYVSNELAKAIKDRIEYLERQSNYCRC